MGESLLILRLGLDQCEYLFESANVGEIGHGGSENGKEELETLTVVDNPLAGLREQSGEESCQGDDLVSGLQSIRLGIGKLFQGV